LRRQHRRIGIFGVERSVDQPLGSFTATGTRKAFADCRCAPYRATRDRPNESDEDITRRTTSAVVSCAICAGAQQQRGPRPVRAISPVAERDVPYQLGERVAGRLSWSGDREPRE
jgi:hypothetical protein